MVTITERTPSASVSLYDILNENDFPSDPESFVYRVQEGQEFGLLCETEPQFTANWFTTNNKMSEPSITYMIKNHCVKCGLSPCPVIPLMYV